MVLHSDPWRPPWRRVTAASHVHHRFVIRLADSAVSSCSPSRASKTALRADAYARNVSGQLDANAWSVKRNPSITVKVWGDSDVPKLSLRLGDATGEPDLDVDIRADLEASANASAAERERARSKTPIEQVFDFDNKFFIRGHETFLAGTSTLQIPRRKHFDPSSFATRTRTERWLRVGVARETFSGEGEPRSALSSPCDTCITRHDRRAIVVAAKRFIRTIRHDHVHAFAFELAACVPDDRFIVAGFDGKTHEYQFRVVARGPDLRKQVRIRN